MKYLFPKGHIAWNKGTNWKPKSAFKKGQVSPRKGVKLSEETKKRISESKKGTVSWNAGKVCPQLAGNNHAAWKGGVSKEVGYKSKMLKKWNVENKDRRNYLTHKRILLKKMIGGSHTLEEWQELKKYWDFTCLMCLRKEPEISLSEDHIKPISKGGTDNIWNLQPLCRVCNSIKNNKILDLRGGDFL